MSANKDRGIRCKINDYDESHKCSLKAEVEYYLHEDGLKILFNLCQDHYEMVTG